MRRYEFVALLDSHLPSEEVENLKKELENTFGDSIVEKDDIGLLSLAYEVKWRDRAYFVSYYLDLDPSSITEMKKDISLKSGVLRFFFYKMNKNEEFLKFHEVNKQLEMTEEEKQQQEKEGAFQDMDNQSKRN